MLQCTTVPQHWLLVYAQPWGWHRSFFRVEAARHTGEYRFTDIVFKPCVSPPGLACRDMMLRSASPSSNGSQLRRKFSVPAAEPQELE